MWDVAMTTGIYSSSILIYQRLGIISQWAYTSMDFACAAPPPPNTHTLPHSFCQSFAGTGTLFLWQQVQKEERLCGSIKHLAWDSWKRCVPWEAQGRRQSILLQVWAGWKELRGRQSVSCDPSTSLQVNFLFSWTFLPFLSLPLSLPSSFPPLLPFFLFSFLFFWILTLYQAPKRHFSLLWLHCKTHIVLSLQMRTLRVRGLECLHPQWIVESEFEPSQASPTTALVFSVCLVLLKLTPY